MKVELSATGTPAQIVASLGKDVEREKKANPGNGRVLHAVRDELYALAKAEGDEANVTVKATIEIEVSTLTPLEADDQNAGIAPAFTRMHVQPASEL